MSIANDQRFQRAMAALTCYEQHPRNEVMESLTYDPNEVISRFLCDLLFYCDGRTVDFDRCLIVARYHFNEQRTP